MAYSSIEDLMKCIPESVLAELGTDEGPYDNIWDSKCKANIENAIYQADREIDSYLVSQHLVPMSDPIPGLILNLSCKMAIHAMHLRKHIQSDVWEREYERCLAALKLIHDGKLGLGAVDETVPEMIPERFIKTSTRTQKFNSTLWSTY